VFVGSAQSPLHGSNILSRSAHPHQLHGQLHNMPPTPALKSDSHTQSQQQNPPTPPTPPIPSRPGTLAEFSSAQRPQHRL
jgi:hypothetical protein